MVPRGLEPRTLRLLAVRSNQLSYETSVQHENGFPDKVVDLSLISIFMDACGLPVLVIAIVLVISISGLVVEYIVAIDVTRVRFPADAYCESMWRT